jgi:hypothetical protein
MFQKNNQKPATRHPARMGLSVLTRVIHFHANVRLDLLESFATKVRCTA